MNELLSTFTRIISTILVISLFFWGGLKFFIGLLVGMIVFIYVIVSKNALFMYVFKGDWYAKELNKKR